MQLLMNLFTAATTSRGFPIAEQATLPGPGGKCLHLVLQKDLAEL